LASIKTINAILVACPSPAFALSSSKKILTFNAPFQQLVRRQLPVAPNEDARHDLKLALDLNVADIFARLEANGETPVATGFVIGAGRPPLSGSTECGAGAGGRAGTADGVRLRRLEQFRKKCQMVFPGKARSAFPRELRSKQGDRAVCR